MHFDVGALWSDALLAVICQAWHVVLLPFTWIYLLFKSQPGTNAGVGNDLFLQVCQIFPDLFFTVFLFKPVFFFFSACSTFACIFPILFFLEKSIYREEVAWFWGSSGSRR